MLMLTRDLFKSATTADSNLLSEDSISWEMATSLALDYSSSALFPEERLTDWMSVSVRATFAVFPSHTSCHERVPFKSYNASPCRPNLDWQVALLR